MAVNANEEMRLAPENRRCALLLLMAGFLACFAGVWPASATMYTLEDRNSTVEVEADSSEGAYSWVVDGTDNMARQWFWVRLGDGPEMPINAIDGDGPQASHQDNDFDPGKESLQLRYEGGGLQIDVSLELAGSDQGSGLSQMIEAITIHNTGRTGLDVHFYQYADLDLAGTAGNDTVQMNPPFGVTQTDNLGWVSEAAETPAPSHYEVGLVPAILDKLNDDDADDLSDLVGPISGDVAWAFQWDVSLGPDGSFIISKSKRLEVPEPATLGLVLVGGLVALKRRK